LSTPGRIDPRPPRKATETRTICATRAAPLYALLTSIELEAEGAADTDPLDALRDRLRRLSRDVMTIRAPLSYAEHLDIFQEHIELLERRIEARRTLVAAAATATDRS